MGMGLRLHSGDCFPSTFSPVPALSHPGQDGAAPWTARGRLAQAGQASDLDTCTCVRCKCTLPPSGTMRCSTLLAKATDAMTLDYVSRLRTSELRKSIAQTTITMAQMAVPALW